MIKTSTLLLLATHHFLVFGLYVNLFVVKLNKKISEALVLEVCVSPHFTEFFFDVPQLFLHNFFTHRHERKEVPPEHNSSYYLTSHGAGSNSINNTAIFSTLVVVEKKGWK